MDNDFRTLLTKYLNGTCTDSEREQVEQWYVMIEDRTLVLPERERRVIGERILENIARSAAPATQRMSDRRRRLKNIGYRIAASLVIVSVFYIWHFSGDVSRAEELRSEVSSSQITIENKTDDIKIVNLPDSSLVRLEAASRIRYDLDFFSSGNRVVHLVGSAFFDIVRNPSRPFYVYSGEIATRVLGTSFYVDAPMNADKVAVKVISGKVSVFKIGETTSSETSQAVLKNSTTNGVVLSPNQRVEYIVEGGHWVTGLVDDPLPLKPKDSRISPLVFSNAPIGEILSRISEQYGIEVITENEQITACTFTGDVSMLPLYDMLDVICNAIGSTFEVKGTRILISGRGCEIENRMD
jgi:ferric-dicitrate binding protein FerR (iron transport regulator)